MPSHRLMLLQDGAVLVRRHDGTVTFPGTHDVKLPASAHGLGEWNGLRWSAAAAPDEEDFPPGFALVPLRSLLTQIPEPLFHLCGVGAHLVHWERHHAFCGRCGASTLRHPSERARRCPSCEAVAHPRISPAVIVAVVRDGKLLLARNARNRLGFRSVLAGFLEVGETLEQCVAREVQEEVGLAVRNVRYFASQPWPFPDSLMIAFTAEYQSGDLKPDPAELADADWYAADALPAVPPPGTVARKLIDWFVNTYAP